MLFPLNLNLNLNLFLKRYALCAMPHAVFLNLIFLILSKKESLNIPPLEKGGRGDF